MTTWSRSGYREAVSEAAVCLHFAQQRIGDRWEGYGASYLLAARHIPLGGVNVVENLESWGREQYGAGQTVYHAMCGVSMHQVDGSSYML